MPTAILALLLFFPTPRETMPICEWHDSIKAWLRAAAQAPLLKKQKYPLNRVACKR